MLELTEIDAIREATVKVIKATRNKLPGQKTKPPEFTPTYKISVEMLEEIKVHAVRGTFPEKLISRRAPNMDEKEYNYIRDNYQQITYPVFLDYLNTILRAFSDDMVIDYNEGEVKTEDSMRWYAEQLLKDSPLKMPLHSWMKQIVPNYKSIDAMGCVVVKPHFIPTSEVEGQVVISDSDRFEPIPYYYPCTTLVSYEDNRYFMFELKEKSVVTFNNKKVKEGIIFELYDDQNIYHIIQTGNKVDYTFETVVYYEHKGGSIPVIRMMGMPFQVDDTGELAWMSPFATAVPSLNDVIGDANNLRSVKAASVFPFKVMVGNICHHKKTMSNGEIHCCDETGGWFYDAELQTSIRCENCKGTGTLSRISPLGIMHIKPQEPLTNESKEPHPALYYVAPAIDTPGFIRGEVELQLNAAREILHLKSKTSLANTITEGTVNTTARGDMIDEKALIAFVLPVRDQLKDIYEFTLEWMYWQRYGKEFQGKVVMPNTIDIKTDQDYLNEISEYIRLGFPSVIVQATMTSFLRRKFSNQKDMAAAFDLILKTDRIITMPFSQYSLELTKGLVAPWEVILHDSAITFIMELQVEEPGFLTLDTEVQQEKLIAKATAKADEIKKLTDQAGQDLVSTVLGRATQNRIAANGS